MKIVGTAVVFGVPSEIKPLNGIPDGARVRFRFSNKDIGRAFVKTPNGIEQGFIECRPNLAGDWWFRVQRKNVRT